MKALKRIIFRLLSAVCIILSCGFLNLQCSSSDPEHDRKHGYFSSYREIPGVTNEEINAIEALRARHDSFIYGMGPTTEAFYDQNGEVRGYAALFSEWLTELFVINFTPVIIDSWIDMLAGLESGEVSFTGDLTPSQDRRLSYFMTSNIAHRSLVCFKIDGSPALSEISKTRLPRYALIEGTSMVNDTLHYAREKFEPVFVSDYEKVYEVLKSGEADAVIAENTDDAFFDKYGDIVMENFFPLIYSPVSLSTQNPELAPVISVVQKALDNGASYHLSDLYEKGNREYKKHKFHLHLTEEERAYISSNPKIYLGAEFDNYPVSFYNQHVKQWQGIAFDLLHEITDFSGLEFIIPHDEKKEFHELIDMLEDGSISLLTEVIITDDRQGRFLWPENFFMEDNSVLISRVTQANINFDKLYLMKIGLTRETAFVEFFHERFPNHPGVVLFHNQEEIFDALSKGKIDMTMTSYSTLMYLTNFLEQIDFKANIIFDDSYKSTFGFNINEEILCSIFDKVYDIIDIKLISEQWLHRTYNYQLRIARAQMPLAYGIAGLLFLLLVIVIIALIVNFRKSKTIAEQTTALALERQATAHYEYDHKLRDALSNITKSSALSAGILNAAAGVIAKEGCLALGTSHVGIWRTNEDAGFLKSIIYYNSVNDEYGIEIDFDLMPHKRFAKLLQTERLIVTNDINNSVFSFDHLSDNKSRICAHLDAPIRVDGKLAGVVCIEQYCCAVYPEGREWTIEEQNFASSLADLMAVAISGEERLKARDDAERASKAKSTFLANMSHEIRTPMNAILGITEILLHDENLPENVNEGLGKIYNSCDLLLGIINDILDFSKIEAGKLDIVPAEYNIASLINDSIHLNMMRIENKPIQFELDIDEKIPAKLIGDELRIKQIFNNLLSNAFKYTDTGEIVLSVYCEPYTEGVLLVIKVKDTGHGMSREQIDKLFSEYLRFVNKSTIEGTGLGLAITRRLVTLMDGEIHVESEPNKGSLFTVYLPQMLVDDEVLGSEVVQNLKSFRQSFSTHRTRTKIIREPMPYGRVLVVDDVETNIDVAVGLMNLYSLKTDFVMSGKKAIEKINSGEVYDIIFMDHMMPEMDGIETTIQLRNSGYNKPIVALTANAVAGQAELFLQNGFDDFIAKPINLRQLNAVLNRLIRDRQPQEVINAARAADKKNKDGISFVFPASHNSQANIQLTASFIRDAKKTKNILESLLKTGEIDTKDGLRKFIISIHGIKSSLANIGQQELSDAAFKMETLAREENFSFKTEILPQFLEDIGLLLNKMEDQRKGNDSNEDLAELRKALIKVKEVCEDYDRKKALDIIGSLKNYSDETKKVLDKITELVIHSEFEEAGSAAAALVYALGDNN